MKVVMIDRVGECDFKVTWMQGTQDSKSRLFDSRDSAESFAKSKMGKTGCVVSTLDMTPDQLQKHQDRKSRIAALSQT